MPEKRAKGCKSTSTCNETVIFGVCFYSLNLLSAELFLSVNEKSPYLTLLSPEQLLIRSGTLSTQIHGHTLSEEQKIFGKSRFLKAFIP